MITQLRFAVALSYLAVGAAASEGQSRPSLDPVPFTRPDIVTKFVWGGVDADSYVYWPSTPPDMRPLELVKSGKREQAFQYCMSKMDTTKGDLRFFYSVQAASLGFGLFKSHHVAAKLAPLVSKPVLNLPSAQRSAAALTYRNELLAMSYSIRLAGMSLNRSQSDPRGEEIRTLSFRKPPFYWSAVPELVREMKHTRLEHVAVYSTIAFNDPNDRHEKVVPMWSNVVQKYPKRADFRLMLKSYSNHLVDGIKYTQADRDAPRRHARIAYELDPKNVRAIYAAGGSYMSSDPVRSERLIRQYLALNTDPKYEIDRAKAVLDFLEKSKK